MKKLAGIFLLVAMLFALAGCGGEKTDKPDTEQNTPSNTDDMEISSSEDEGSVFSWPVEIPEELTVFDGVQLNNVIQDTYVVSAWTVYFESSDKQKVLDYIERTKAAGYAEVAFSENDFGLNYNGSNDKADININFVPGSTSKLYIAVKTTDGASASAQSKAWPEEFAKWGVPVIQSATVSLADNKSATAEGITQGVNAIVNLQQLSKSDFEAYTQALETAGFEKNTEESVEGFMLSYEKNVTGGVIVITLFYAEDITTISVNNSAAAAEKDAAAGGSVNWPEPIKTIPEFTKGSFKETVEMGGGMYALTFLNVTEADLVWYRGVLENAGFISQDSEDTEGYVKMGKATAYSVGFGLEGDTLQIVAMSTSY